MSISRPSRSSPPGAPEARRVGTRQPRIVPDAALPPLPCGLRVRQAHVFVCRRLDLLNLSLGCSACAAAPPMSFRSRAAEPGTQIRCRSTIWARRRVWIARLQRAPPSPGAPAAPRNDGADSSSGASTRRRDDVSHARSPKPVRGRGAPRASKPACLNAARADVECRAGVTRARWTDCNPMLILSLSECASPGLEPGWAGG